MKHPSLFRDKNSIVAFEIIYSQVCIIQHPKLGHKHHHSFRFIQSVSKSLPRTDTYIFGKLLQMGALNITFQNQGGLVGIAHFNMTTRGVAGGKTPELQPLTAYVLPY